MNKEMNQEEKVHRSRKKTVYRLSGEIRQYKKDALLSPLFTIFCVILEILIPYLTASIIDQGISRGRHGPCGARGPFDGGDGGAGDGLRRSGRRAQLQGEHGFASNLRMAMFEQIRPIPSPTSINFPPRAWSPA